MQYLNVVKESLHAAFFHRKSFGDIVSRTDGVLHAIMTLLLVTASWLLNYALFYSANTATILLGLPLLISITVGGIALLLYFIHALTILLGGNGAFTPLFTIIGSVSIIQLLSLVPKIGLFISIPTTIYLYIYTGYALTEIYNVTRTKATLILITALVALSPLLYLAVI